MIKASEAEQDDEGRQVMRTLARNMAFLMKSIALGKERYVCQRKKEQLRHIFSIEIYFLKINRIENWEIEEMVKNNPV